MELSKRVDVVSLVVIVNLGAKDVFGGDDGELSCERW